MFDIAKCWCLGSGLHATLAQSDLFACTGAHIMKLPAILKSTRLSKIVFAPASSRILRVTVGATLTYLLVMLAATLFLPMYIGHKLKAEVAQQFGRELQLGKLSFNPFRLALSVEQVNLLEADKKSSFLKVGHIYINASLASVWRGALVFDELVVSQPELHVLRKNLEGAYNFSDVLQKIQAMPASPEPLHFAMANLQLSGGRIVFEDSVKRQQVQLQDLQLTLPFVSNFPSELEIFVEPHLQFKLDNKLLALRGKTKPFSSSHESRLSLNIEGVNLLPYLAYLPEQVAVQFKSAALSSQLDLIFLNQAGLAQMQLQGQFALHDWHVQDKAGHDLLKFAEFTTSIKQIDWHKQQLELGKLNWRKPEVWLELDQQGRLNWQKLITASAPEKVASATPKPNPARATGEAKPATSNVTSAQTNAWHWRIEQAQIDQAQLNLQDAAFAQPATRRKLQDLSLHLQNLSNHPDAKAANFDLQFAASERKNKVEPEHWQLKGKLSLAQTRLDAELKLEHLQFADYQAWMRPWLNLKLNGSLAAQAEIQVAGSDWKIQQANLNLSSVQLKSGLSDDAGMAFETLQLKQLNLDSKQRLVQLGVAELSGWDMRLNRNKEGAWNWQDWLSGASKTSATTEAAALPANKDATKATPWRVETGRLQLRDAKLALNDAAIFPNVSLQAEKINLELQNWQSDMAKAMPVNFQAQLGRKAQFKLQGEISPKLAQIALQLDANAIPMAALFPYVSPYLNVSITRARTDLNGKLVVTQALQVENLNVAFDGRLAVNNFHALENGAEDDFLQWKNLQADGLHLQWGPQQRNVLVEKLGLSDFYARLFLSEKGKLNLQNILLTKADIKTESPANAQASGTSTAQTSPQLADTGAKKSPVALKVEVKTTELKNGNINFTDNFIRPNYTANLTSVGGTIGRFANDQTEPAKLELTGKVDDDAPLLVSGTINPLAQPVFLDIKGSTNGLELPRLTPYAAKYAGYAIEKGKLSVQVAYHLENHHLQAQNDLRLDQLTFGEKIDSPHATRLPVLLAVALLKDSDGQININLPISGSLSDPQFSVGSIISKVLVNLLTKAVTSPFALLASMFGHGNEELSSLEFIPGSAAIDDAAKTKLDTLAKALNNRPALKLDILGRAQRDLDIPALKEAELAEQLREAKWKDQRSKLKGQDKTKLSLSTDEEARYLQKLYSEAKWEKPRNMLGLAKTLTQPETRAALLQHIEIRDEDLLQLAQQRADVVRDYLEDTAKLSRERMFIIAPKISHADEKGKHQHKVDFSLK